MRIAVGTLLFAAAALAGAAPAPRSDVESYPARPIRVVIPFTPGSNSDMLARLIGP
jgi:tripartite-type tricarboxylate transporter receptor subunit TctC